MSVISYYRGDYYPQELTVTNKATGDPVDITGATFLLTVNSEKKPVDASNQLFQISGVLDADPTTGKVVFSFEEQHTNIEIGTYYYDIQMVLAGTKRTIKKNSYKIHQDITKT